MNNASPLLFRAISFLALSIILLSLSVKAQPSQSRDPEETLNLAELLQATGHPREAESKYLEVIAEMASREPDPMARRFRARAALSLADLYLSENKANDAEALSKQAITEAQGSSDYINIVLRAGVDLWHALSAQERQTEALPILNEISAELQRRGVGRSSNDEQLGSFYDVLGKAQASTNKVANDSVAQFGPYFSIPRSASNWLAIYGISPEIVTGVGPDMPNAVLAQKLRVFADAFTYHLGPRSPLTAQVELSLAAALLKAGDARQAFDEAWKADLALRDTATPEVGSLKNSVSDGSMALMNSGTLTQSAYVLGGFNGASSDTEYAFEVYQRAQDNETQRSMRISIGLRNAKDAKLAGLVSAREAAASARSDAISKLVYGHSGDLLTSQDALRSYDQKISDIDKILANDFKTYAGLLAPHPVSVSEVQSYLRPNEALIAYQVSQNETAIWILRSTNAKLLVVPVNSGELSSLIKGLRKSVDWLGTGREIPYDLSASFAVYSKIFAPIRTELDGVKRILLVPDGPLASIPFHMLTSSPPEEIRSDDQYKNSAWLMQSYDFVTLPGISSLRFLRSRRRTSDSSVFFGFGDPVLAPRGDSRGPHTLEVRGGDVNPAELRSLPSLPESGEELRAIARSLPSLKGQLFLQNDATVSKIQALNDAGTLRTARIIVFATHALVVRAANDNQAAEAGLVFTPPPVGRADARDNGLLTSSDVLTLRLNADWVVLSACNTAAESDAVGHPIAGLSKAFAYAGADALLTSNWNVSSRAAEKLMTSVFEGTAKGDDKARALTMAMASYLENSTDARSSHPAYWAPFVVFGD